MSIQSELFTRLKNDAGVSALVGARIHPLKAPQDVVKPYITYQIISGKSNQCIEGEVYQKDVRFQVDCWSESYLEADSIKNAVESAINGFKSSYDINSMEDYEPETLLYRQLIDFKLKG